MPLIQRLKWQRVDIVGDVHGEIDALLALVEHLGYDECGQHPQGRHLIFLGDLTDRGPDSPAVVHFVSRLVLERQSALCVLGNHELNLLHLKEKPGNRWFHGKTESLDRSGEPTPAKLADDSDRARTLELFRQLPLALEGEGLRIVHACWNDWAIEAARNDGDVLTLYEQHRQAIDQQLDAEGIADPVARALAHQNRNPVKLLTSGPERRLETPIEVDGRERYEGRHPWWEEYSEASWCLFGHYSLKKVEPHSTGEPEFDQSRLYAPLGPGKALCIDYSAARRYLDRKYRPRQHWQSRLAAFRWPERMLIFDDGETMMVQGR